MSLDAFTLISKVVDRTAQKCGQLGPLSGLALDDEQRAEMMVETLATQLMNFLGLGASKGDVNRDEPSDLERICDDQIRRNRNLARALGACDCWGELPTCDRCHGRGAVGWRRPDAERFDRLVRPVIHKMTRHRLKAHAARGVHTQRMPY